MEDDFGEVQLVRIGCGSESISPIRYNTYTVSPIEVTVKPPPGASFEEVVAHWKPRLEAVVDQMAKDKFEQWKRHYMAASED